MKRSKVLFTVACVGGVGYLAARLLQSDAVQSKLMGGKYDDTVLNLMEKARTLGDILGWPIHFVRALLP